MDISAANSLLISDLILVSVTKLPLPATGSFKFIKNSTGSSFNSSATLGPSGSWVLSIM